MQSASLRPFADTGAYRVERTEVDHLDPSVCREWIHLLEQHGTGSPMHDPRSLREPAVHGSRRSVAYLLYQGRRLCGVAPFQMRDWPLKWQVGEITVAGLPLRRLCLLGGGMVLPEDRAVYALLFQALQAERGFDALFLEDIPISSVLWKFVADSPAIASAFSRYAPGPPKPRILLRFEGSFDDYLGKFSAKHRNTLKRKLRHFETQAMGEVRTIRITAPEEIEPFVTQAVEISRKTYQWNLLGLGLRSPDALKEHLDFMARQGWLRAYLLTSRGVACAFVIGFQYGGRFYLDDMGYDPAWRDHSVGTVLQLEIIRDLFEYHPAQTYDMGEYGPHKEEFGTDSYLQGSLFLFRRGLYPKLILAGHSACAAVTIHVSTIAERFGWKNRLKRIIRRWSSRP